MSELSWIEGPSGAAGYTPITLSFLARDIDLEDGTVSHLARHGADFTVARKVASLIFDVPVAVCEVEPSYVEAD